MCYKLTNTHFTLLPNTDFDKPQHLSSCTKYNNLFNNI